MHACYSSIKPHPEPPRTLNTHICITLPGIACSSSVTNEHRNWQFKMLEVGLLLGYTGVENSYLIHILVKQCSRVALYHGIFQKLLVFSSYTCTAEPLGECICKENASDKRNIPWYSTRKHCITILYHVDRKHSSTYTMAFRHFAWLYFLRHGMNVSITLFKRRQYIYLLVILWTSLVSYARANVTGEHRDNTSRISWNNS